jgi:hypothetical protein
MTDHQSWCRTIHNVTLLSHLSPVLQPDMGPCLDREAVRRFMVWQVISLDCSQSSEMQL